ncbi:acyl transferase 8-like isoform X1 [Panicum virgatum]|uniref:acyl transferase 8-like isoform X1 n=1 Tax=Panicum virgatum TaxID=38727 RepID=UPI0019D560CE|nr:acyl transferase 8-like isoform X1 [Panicum virgatum]XP_039843906.1 acyl transferase 8-like isoform X1 [Panicum virgatum]
MTSSQVRVLNISHVRPVQTDGASPPGQGEHKLSFMDLLQISKTIQRLFFDGPDLPPFPTVVSALRSSLAATLAVFPPLAGELAFRPVSGSGDVVIDSSPAAIASSPGVRFVEAEFAGGADAMRRLARDDAHDAEAFARLVPELLEARRLPAPVLAVQVTRPAAGAGAVAVGVSIAHAVADGHAVWQFLRAWSTASREGPASLAAPGFVPPTFDRAGIRHPKSAELVRSVLSRVAPALPLASVVEAGDHGAEQEDLLAPRRGDPVPEAAHPRTERSSQPRERRATRAAEHLRRRHVPGVGVCRPGDASHARRRRRPPHGQRGLPAPPAPAARQRLLRDLRQGVLRAGPRGGPARRGRRRARRRGHPAPDPRAPRGGRPAVGRRGLAGGVRRRAQGEARDGGVVQPVRGVRDGLRVGRAAPRRAGVPVRAADGDAARREGRRRAGVGGARRGHDGRLRGQLRRPGSRPGGWRCVRSTIAAAV